MKYTVQLKIAKDFINKIIAGELSEGDTLPSEMELVSIYKASRPTVREAIKILSTRNIILSKQRAGTKVLPISQWNLLDPVMITLVDDEHKIKEITSDFARMRSLIEKDVISSAIDNINEQGKRDLTEAFNNLISLEPTSNSEELVNADYEFHRIIYENSKNHAYSSLPQIFKALWLNEIDMILENKLAFYIEDHTKIYNAIMTGDKSNLNEIISYHLDLLKNI